MTVKEVKEQLDRYPDDMPVVLDNPIDMKGINNIKLGAIEEGWDDDYKQKVVILYT